MPSKAIICLSAVLALLPISVHADFKVFCGERCVGADAGGCGVACQFMNNPASCDDVNDSIVFHTEKDVSGCGGVRCKGCDQSKPSKEWDIEELEINDTQECTPSSKNWDGLGEDVDPHFTIYNDDGFVNILDTDGNNVGTCTVPDDPQVVECGSAWGNIGWTNLFDCESDLYYIDSVN